MRRWTCLLLCFLLSGSAWAQVHRKPPPRKRRPATVVEAGQVDPVPRVFSPHDSLLLAAATNNVPLARHLLARGVPVNQSYADSLYRASWSDSPGDALLLPGWTQVQPGETPLHLAVAQGHLAMVDLLLRHGAQPLLRGEHQWPPLFRALDYVPNQRAVVERLLANGLPFDTCHFWKSPLGVVIEYNATMRRQLENARPDRARQLRAARRRGMLAPRRQQAPLHPLRSDSLNLYLLQLLTAAGARPTVEDLQLAVRSHELGLARYLLTHGVGVNEQDTTSGQTALHLAVELQDTVALPLLLAQGADPNVPNRAGSTPLFVAAGQNSPRLTTLLLAAGAYPGGFAGAARCPDCRDGQLRPPLHQAVQYAQLATVRLLLAAGAPPNACDADQYTPLQLAVRSYLPMPQRVVADDWGGEETPERLAVHQQTVRSQHERLNEIVRLLLAAGASPNVTGYDGSGPLAQAVSQGDTLRVGLLLRAGADPNQPGQRGERPLQWVQSAAVLGQMRRAGARFGEGSTVVLLNTVDFRGNPLPLAITAAALADGGNLREITVDGDTPLHLAAANPDADLGTVALFLAHGADPNACNYVGWTPLTAAVVSERTGLAQLLLDAGARPDADPSPLAAAARLGSEALVQLLLRYGAAPNAVDRHTGETPLLAAFTNAACPPALVAQLLAAGASPLVADSAGSTPLHRLLAQRRAARPAEQAAVADWQRSAEWRGQHPAAPSAAEAAPPELAARAEACLLATGQLLLQAGAPIDARNDAGETVRDLLRAIDSPASRQLLAEVEKAARR